MKLKKYPKIPVHSINPGEPKSIEHLCEIFEKYRGEDHTNDLVVVVNDLTSRLYDMAVLCVNVLLAEIKKEVYDNCNFNMAKELIYEFVENFNDFIVVGSEYDLQLREFSDIMDRVDRKILNCKKTVPQEAVSWIRYFLIHDELAQTKSCGSIP